MLNAAHQATLTTTALDVGPHSIVARYLGDPRFAGSDSPALTETIVKATTKTTLATSAPSAALGDPVTFTATVVAVAPGAGLPRGTVTFFDGATTIGAGFLNPAGQTSLVTSSLLVGSRAITAHYESDGRFASSVSASLVETITPF